MLALPNPQVKPPRAKGSPPRTSFHGVSFAAQRAIRSFRASKRSDQDRHPERRTGARDLLLRVPHPSVSRVRGFRLKRSAGLQPGILYATLSPPPPLSSRGPTAG